MDTDPGILPKCIGEDCVTVGYFIIGDDTDPHAPEYDWIHHVMDYLAGRNDLRGGDHVKNLKVTTRASDIKLYLDDNLNKTWYGVVFCTSQWEDSITSNITIPCKPANYDPQREDAEVMFYSILYNYTLMPSAFLQNWTAPAEVDPNMLIIKNSLDSGIVDYLKTRNGYYDNENIHFDDFHNLQDEVHHHIEVSWSHFPLISSRAFSDGDISSVAGTFYVALGPIVTFVIMLTEIVREKEQKLRQGL